MSKIYKIGVIKGDGIGPEITNEAIKVLDSVSVNMNFKLEYHEMLLGGVAYEETGVPLPKETMLGVKECDAVLFGAIGNPKFDNLARDLRPETGLLKLRKHMNIFANLRPIKIYQDLIKSSPLKSEVVDGVDIMVVRELIGGIYFGEPRGISKDRAYNTMVYTKEEIVRVAKVAFEIAIKRNKKVCSVDKANVLEVSQFWRETVIEVSKDYPEIELTHMYVDNAAMQIVKNPRQFDVILTGNIFGDILSDLASIITGSIGLLPSASIGDKVGLYEPIHGSAPDIAGQGISNPIASILSAAMILKYSLNENEASLKIEEAIEKTLNKGYRTNDISSDNKSEICSCSEIGDIIANYVAVKK